MVCTENTYRRLLRHSGGVSEFLVTLGMDRSAYSYEVGAAPDLVGDTCTGDEQYT